MHLASTIRKLGVELIIAKTGLLSGLSRGREDFSDFESSVLRLKYTRVADCKPQAPQSVTQILIGQVLPPISTLPAS